MRARWLASIRTRGRAARQMLRGSIRRSILQDSGSALLEFAATAVLFFSVIFGIIACCLAVYTGHFLASAAQEATRYAMVRGGSWPSACATTTSYGCSASSSNVSAFVQTLVTPGINGANVVTTTTWPGTAANGSSCVVAGKSNAAGCTVRVTLTYSFRLLVPFMPAATLPLTSTSVVTIVQ